MAFSVIFRHDDLKAHLSTVGKAVSTKTTLPVLNNILIALEGNRIKFSGTNLEISITSWSDTAIVEQPPTRDKPLDAITIPAKLLTEFVSQLPSTDPVSIELRDDDLSIVIRSGRNIATIKGIAAADFPTLPITIRETDKHYRFSMDSETLKSTIRMVAFAASTDETRPVLTGINVKLGTPEDTETAWFAAADAFRLTVRSVTIASPDEDPVTVIVPARALRELERVLPGGDATDVGIAVTRNKAQIIFTMDNLTFTSSLIEGTFPDYTKIIPTQYTTLITVDTGEVTRKAKVCRLFAEGSNIVRLTATNGTDDLTPGALTLTSNAETVDGRADMDAVIAGPDIKAAFNVKYLLEGLEAQEATQVHIELQSSTQPLLMRNDEDPGYRYVVMPMHLSS